MKGKEKDFHQLLVADAKSRGWVGLGLSVGITLSVKSKKVLRLFL